MFRGFRNVCAAGFAAAAVFCPAGALFPTAAHATDLTEVHGAWRGFFFNDADTKGFGVRADIGEGGALFVIMDASKIKQGLKLVMVSPEWPMTVGETLPVHVTIDNETYDGEAEAVRTGMLKVPPNLEIVSPLFHGKEVTVRIDRIGLDWDLSLNGFKDAFVESVNSYNRVIEASESASGPVH